MPEPLEGWVAALAMVLTLAACPAAGEPSPSVAPTSDASTEAAPAPEAGQAASLRVILAPRIEPSPEVVVHVELRGPAEPDEALKVWTMPGPLAAVPLLAVRDAVGELAPAIEASEGGLRVSFDRAPTPPVHLDYALAPVDAPIGSLARLELDADHMFATGEALLLLPEGALDRRLTLDLSIDASAFEPGDPQAHAGLSPLRAASSFAAEAETRVEGWPFELRRAAWVVGHVEWAEFDSMHGQDRWLGVGSTLFDQRWSAAELAAVRSTVDGRIGLPTVDPLVVLMRSGSRRAVEPAFRAELRGRGLVIDADSIAYWDVGARMAVGVALVRRWLGGRVRVWTADPGEGERRDRAEAEALWFEAGVTRYVARELLWELGLLDEDEYAAELDLVELELASSPLRERTLAELGELLATSGPDGAGSDPIVRADATAALVARGAMYMAWLDGELRASERGVYGVIEIVRILVARAVAEERRDLRLDELLGIAASKFATDTPRDPELLAMFEAVVGRGERPRLGPGVHGPCFAPRKRKLRRFELGLVDGTRLGDERPTVVSVDPEGPAAAAGLREDDAVVSLDYAGGDATTSAVVEVERDGAIQRIEYLPAGPQQRVVVWERVAGVPPESCVR